jgi:hypothetical protein
MFSSSRAIESWRSRSARVTVSESRFVAPDSSVTRSYEAENAGAVSVGAATMHPYALFRLLDYCTRTDSIRETSCARHVKIAGQAVRCSALTHLP